MADAAQKYGDDETKRFCERFARAKSRRELLNPAIDDCYRLAIPLQDRPYATQAGTGADIDLFDSTAPAAVQDLASQMLDDVWPTDSKPFELVAGDDVDEADREELNRALADVSDDLITTINNSNFRDAAHQALMDWQVGTGFILPEDGDHMQPVRFRHLPLPDAITDTGPYDDIDCLFRERKVRLGHVGVIWPGAKLPDELATKAAEEPDKEIGVIEGTERDWSQRGSEAWNWRVAISSNQKETIFKKRITGWGAKPFVDFSYIRVHNEPLGRGPIHLALGDIKSVNLVKQFILENADLAIGGLWDWEHDGVMNPDNITIAPRTIITRMPGSDGLKRIEAAGNFNVGDMVLRDLQQSIREILLGDDLGPTDKTPMSATEVLERSSRRARRRAGPYSKLIIGLLFQTVRRVAFLRVKQGAIRLPEIDGRTIKFRALAPLTRAQAQDEILRHDRYLEMINARLGPQVAMLTVDALAYADQLGNLMGVNPKVLRRRVDRQKLVAALTQMAANGGGEAEAAA